MLKDQKNWPLLKTCLEKSGAELVDLHDRHKIYQGGLNFESVVYAGVDKECKFLNWSYSCTPIGVKIRLQNPNHYYFKVKIKADFEELIISDLLAFTLIYADLVGQLNSFGQRPSWQLQSEWHKHTNDEWNGWLLKAQLTGIDEIDKFIYQLAKSGQKNYYDLSV